MSILFPISRFGYNNRQSNFDTIYNTFFDSFMTPTASNANGFRNVASVPRANVLKTDEGYTIELAAPGFARDEFEISVDNGVLSVHVGTSDTKDYSEKLTVQEYSYSSFTRSWNLPDGVNVEAINARYEAGILSLDVPTAGKKIKRHIVDVE